MTTYAIVQIVRNAEYVILLREKTRSLKSIPQAMRIWRNTTKQKSGTGNNIPFRSHVQKGAENMSVTDWIYNRDTDLFVIVDDDGIIIYDARKTNYDPQNYICNSLIVDIYTWNGLTVLAI